MHTASFVRRHINQLKDDKPFSIRDFLNYGSRNAIDQAFHKLVKSGRIIRVARGLFIKETGPTPSILDVALAKAKGFGKTLFIHGSQAAFELKLWANPITDSEAIYACDGSSSSFRFGQIRIRFINTSARKRSLGDDINLVHKLRLKNDICAGKIIGLVNDISLDNGLASLTINALWYLGKTKCSAQLIYDVLLPFNRIDRQSLREQIKLMPTWLASYFVPSEKRKKFRFKFHDYLSW